MNRISILLPILSFCVVHSLSANRSSTNYSIGPETFAGLAGDSNSSAYAQFSAVEPLSGLSVKNMPDFKNFAGFIGHLPPLDQDGDGLPDSQEAILGTDKTLVDTDADGLTDGEEVSLGTNPLVADSDGDGYSDFAEAQASTNPLLASSNPNQAPSLITLSNSSVLENQPPQTVVGRLTATDPDGSGNLSLSLVSKGDGSLFLIDQQDNLITASIFDYESPKKNFSVTVRASDDKNASLQKTFVIQLLNQVEDLDGDGVEDQVDPDRDGDGFSNTDELASGSDPSDPNSMPLPSEYSENNQSGDTESELVDHNISTPIVPEIPGENIPISVAEGVPDDWPEYANLVQVHSNISIDTTWKASNSYLLSDLVFVTNGATLTIEPGTFIYADLADEHTAPALVVTQGSKIYAEGTKDQPIVFTSVLDLRNSLSKEDKGLWGGLIILGHAPINSNKSRNLDNQPLTNSIDGVPDYSNLSNRSIPQNHLIYGGDNFEDNSGVLKFVSIRHCGAKGSGWGLKGLSLAGIGSKSTFEHIEVFATKDDGIDILGGVVSAKYLSVAYSGDDSFDIDEGYAGVLQFLLSIQDDNSNSAIEVDGSTESDDLKAYTSLLPDWSQPTIANVTAIGIGKDRNSSNSYGNLGLKFRDNGAGTIWNSIFTEFPDGIITVENTVGRIAYSSDSSESSMSIYKGTPNPATGNYGSQALLEMGTLGIKGNLFFNSGLENTPGGLTLGIPEVANVIFDENNGNSYDLDPELINLMGKEEIVSPFPNSSSPAFLGAKKLNFDPYFLSYNDPNLMDFKLERPDQVSFQGAFAAGRNWTEGWTKIDQTGIIASPPKFGDFEVVSSDIVEDTTWKSSSVYLLTDLIFVTNGATLTIEPGTLIKAVQGAGDDSPCIIVTQGSKIHAAGTSEKPIIFTSILDQGENLSKDDKGLWGGLIVLGNAPINSNGDDEDNNPLSDFFDSIPLVSPSTGRILPANGGKYGGNDPSDTSGVLEYVSIRHAGLGAADAFSLAGVGNGTTINHVEIYAAERDGLEIHGGSFNAKKLVVAYAGDDSIDIDQGFNGHLQFLFSIQDENSDCFIDSDGSNELEDRAAVTSSLPDWSEPIIANFTAIGPASYEKSRRIKIKDNAGGLVLNSIFTDFGQYIMEIEKTSTHYSYGLIDSVGVPKGTMNPATGNAGSQALLEMGILGFKGNLFYKENRDNFSLDTPTNSLITIRGGDFEDLQKVADIIFDSANENAYDINPLLVDIDNSDGILFPFPTSNSPALSGAVSLSEHSFLKQTQYRGAFADKSDNWLANWSKSDDFIADLRVEQEDNNGLNNDEELNEISPEPEPLSQVPTFKLVDNQISENSPVGSFAGKLFVPDLNGTQTLSFVLSEPSPFELMPNGTLLAKRSFDFESDPASLPLTITATNDSNQSLEMNFAVTLLNEIEDLDGDGFEDALDPDIDGDGLSNKDEALAGTDPRIEDSDEDELSDGEEITLKTNPLSDDSDQDGLTDGTEIGIGTNPLAKDTDGDGFNDQEEVLAGSFPEDANDYPGKQVVFERDPNEGPDGLLYQLSEEKFTLEEAIHYAAQKKAVIPYLTVSTAHSKKDPLEIFLVQFMTRNSSLKKPKAWVLGETQDFFGFERKTILTQRGSRFTFTGNRKLQVLLGYEKPPVRIPYLKTLAAEIDGNKVRVSGELMDDGGEKPFRSGFRISEKILVQENDPTARIVSASLKDNILEAVVERLEPGTTYYLRAFAENSAGVAYGAFKRIKLTESYDAPFAGKPEGQGWFRSDWFGLFLPANENWVFHQDFEWIYHGPTNQNGIWFWSERIGWSWTREDVWPYLWMNNQSNWTYYFGKKGGQPTFWDYSNQSVFRWRNPVSWAGSNDSLPQ